MFSMRSVRSFREQLSSAIVIGSRTWQKFESSFLLKLSANCKYKKSRK